jgi:hypothetical protein
LRLCVGVRDRIAGRWDHEAVLIRPSDLARIRDGEIDLAFRRWERPRLLVGTRMRTVVGLVEVTSVDRVDDVTDDDAARAGADREQLLRLMEPRAPAPIWRVGLRFAGADPRAALREQHDLSAEDRAALVARLDRFDRASPHGPWTREVLQLIRAHPARRAPELAEELGRETAGFKRDVRKLKELGLTESLDVGYRLSPRGAALLDGRDYPRPGVRMGG